MSDFGSKSFDQGQNSDLIDDDDFEKDDLITFQHNSKTINFSYSKLTKYSKQIREEYLFSDVIKRFPQEIERKESSSQLLPENVDLFFALLEQNYEINENRKITYKECIDLLKISKYFEIRKLSYKIKEYIKTHNNEVEFIIQILEYEHKTNKIKKEEQNEINKEMEIILTTKINEFKIYILQILIMMCYLYSLIFFFLKITIHWGNSFYYKTFGHKFEMNHHNAFN